MKVTEECFSKVKKDCFKFIKSQETSTEKFGNKDGMLKSFLIPMCFWIAKKTNNKKPYFVGLAGGQGTGKTTISSIIKIIFCLLYTSPSPRDTEVSRMPSSA